MPTAVDGFRIGTQAASLEASHEFYFGKPKDSAMTWTNRYRDRVNAGNLARQAAPVQAKAKEILASLEDIEKYLYWAIDPEETKDGVESWTDNLIGSAHALVDMGHEYRAALALSPPPEIPEENPEDDLQSSR